MVSNYNSQFKGLSGNFLKIIALITMTIDHAGLELFDDCIWMRIIGRISFPIFAYMIAEGCTYTKNKIKHFTKIFLLAILCQIVYFVVIESLYQCIFITFSLSIALIYSFDNLLKNRTIKSIVICFFTTVIFFVATIILPQVLANTDYKIDYGICGVLLPVFVYFAKQRKDKLLLFAAGLLLLCFYYGGIQWYSLATVPLIALYNGKRGKLKLKNLFYIYYPLHLVAIYFIGVLF